MKKLILLSLSALTIAACDTQVKNFVSIPSQAPLTPAPFVPTGNSQLKISPGSVMATSAANGIQATITPTQQKMSSASLGMQVGISKMSR